MVAKSTGEGECISAVTNFEIDEILVVPAAPEYQITQADCLGGNGGLAFVNAGDDLYYSIDGGSFILYTGELSLPVGNYDFIIKYGTDGCSSDEFMITIGRPQEVDITLLYEIIQPDCETLEGTILILNSEILNYTVTNTATNFVHYNNVAYPIAGFSGLPPGEYLITGVSNNGCASGSVLVSLDDPDCQVVEGCTLGYWKNHIDRWCDAYSSTTRYGSVFVNAPAQLKNLTLLQVLNLGGGGINNLGRQSVAALLNTCSNEVDYTYTSVQELAAYVNGAFSSGRGAINNAGTYLDELNNAGCPLGGTSATTSSEVESKQTDGVKADFSAYPVPFRETLNIRYDFDYVSDVTIQFFDMKGQLLRTYHEPKAHKGSVSTFEIDFSMKANQIYILKLITNRDVFVKQIVSDK